MNVMKVLLLCTTHVCLSLSMLFAYLDRMWGCVCVYFVLAFRQDDMFNLVKFMPFTREEEEQQKKIHKHKHTLLTVSNSCK